MFYSKIYKNLVKRVKDWDRESFYVIAIKDDNILGIKRIAIGEYGSISINPFEIQRYLNGKDVDGYIIAHTHPFNDTSHSFADVCTTNYFKNVIKGVFRGSMIITRKNYDFVPIIWEEEEHD